MEFKMPKFVGLKGNDRAFKMPKFGLKMPPGKKARLKEIIKE